MTKAKSLFRRFVGLLKEKDVFFNASAISFNLFLFSIPFTLLVGSIIGYLFSLDSVMTELTRYAKEFLPAGLYEQPGSEIVDPNNLFSGLVQPLIDARRSNLLIGFAILTFTSLALFSTLKQVLFKIFDGIGKKHRFSDVLYSFLTFGIVGSIFVFFSYLVSLLVLFSTQSIDIPSIGLYIGIGWMYDLASTAVSVLFTLSVFYVLFRYLCERLIERRTALIGALVFTVLFELFRHLFGFFLSETLRTYETVYQGYSILLILTLWTFHTAILFTVSAVAARAWQDEYR